VYIERAAAQAGAGGAGLEDAIRGLDTGIARLGPVVTLELAAADMEVLLGRYDAALSRIDRVAAQSGRKEPWLARTGAILEKAGRSEEALATYRTAPRPGGAARRGPSDARAPSTCRTTPR
jgi:hypothetical protein